jgi:hypothetical protein
MSRNPYLRHSYQTPQNLEFYPLVKRRELKNINAKFQVEVGYWASSNHLHDYKIYGIMIKMVCPNFLINMRQPPGNNPWPTHPTNQNYKMQLHKHIIYSDFKLKGKQMNKYCYKNGRRTLLTLKRMHTKQQYSFTTEIGSFNINQ